MTNESPLGSTEEGVAFDVTSAGSRSKTSILVFDEQFADQGLAKTDFGQ